MRRKKTGLVFAVCRQRSFRTLLAVAVVYLLLLLTFESPFFFQLVGDREVGEGGVGVGGEVLGGGRVRGRFLTDSKSTVAIKLD